MAENGDEGERRGCGGGYKGREVDEDKEERKSGELSCRMGEEEKKENEENERGGGKW